MSSFAYPAFWISVSSLVLGVAAIAVHRARAWTVSIGIAFAAAWAIPFGAVDFVGVTELVALALLLHACARADSRSDARPVVRIAAGVAALALAVLLSDHALPGFRNPMIFDHVRFSPDAAPFTMYLNLEKVMVGLLITLIFTGDRRRTALSRADRAYVGRVLAVLVLVMLGAAWGLGYVAFDPKWPPGAWAWALDNLLFVTLAEEALFRGFVLETSLRRGPGRIGRALAVLISAFAFGLMHYRGGVPYVALSTLAGVFYGAVYVRTRQVRASMAVHFGLNLVHFVLFTYPSLARVG